MRSRAEMEKGLNVAIFASGGGSNAEVLIEHFQNNDAGIIVLIVTDNSQAHVLERAKKYEIKTFIHNKEDTHNGKILASLRQERIDFIVLAGYLKKIGDDLLRAFPKKIVNVHPALLPKYGGKGMYGMNVHKAVVEAAETKTGLTIHYVNENYDEGEIIEQHFCDVDLKDTAEKVQKKVLALEHANYADCIERILKRLI